MKHALWLAALSVLAALTSVAPAGEEPSAPVEVIARDGSMAQGAPTESLDAAEVVPAMPIRLPDDLGLVLAPHRQGRAIQQAEGPIWLMIPSGDRLVPFLRTPPEADDGTTDCTSPEALPEGIIWLFTGRETAVLVLVPHEDPILFRWSTERGCLTSVFWEANVAFPYDCETVVEAHVVAWPDAEWEGAGAGDFDERGDWLPSVPGVERMTFAPGSLRLVRSRRVPLVDEVHLADSPERAVEHRARLGVCPDGEAWIVLDMGSEVSWEDGGSRESILLETRVGEPSLHYRAHGLGVGVIGRVGDGPLSGGRRGTTAHREQRVGAELGPARLCD
jgi:hypothetical protein